MNRRSCLLLCFALSFLVSLPALAQPAPLSGLNDYINKALKDWEIPGLAIAVVKDDSIVYMKGFGVQKVGTNIPVNERTIFAIASTSKAITSAALGILVDEGKLKWNDPVTKYLKGFQLYDYLGKKIVSHDGALHGMRARVALVPEEKLGLVILMNSTRSTLHNALMYRIVDGYLGAPERDWSAEYLKLLKDAIGKEKAEEKKKDDERVKNTKPSLPVESYVGTYSNQMYGEAKITLENGKLMLQFGPNYLGELSHWHYDTFDAVWKRREWGKDTMVFSLNEKGKIASFKWEGLGEFKKKDEK